MAVPSTYNNFLFLFLEKFRTMGPRTSGISLSPTPGDTSISGMAQAEGSPYSTHTPKTQSSSRLPPGGLRTTH